MNGSITWVDRAGSVCRVEFQPGFTWSEPARHNMIPVDRAGPVCRDEIQPAFTWSGPAGDVCACFILQNSPFLRQKSENRGFWASFDARSWNGRTGREGSRAARGKRKWGERRKDGWPRDSFLDPFSHFTTARQNSLKNPNFRTSGEGRGCFAV